MNMHDDQAEEKNTPLVLGLDAGSVSAALAVLSPEKKILHTDYRFHHGQIAATLEQMLESVDLSRVAAVCVTHFTPQIIDADWRCDDRVAVIAAAGLFYEKIGAILHVGGEKFSLMRFDSHGRYAGLQTNTSCAAGTGSFLDQQAGRLNLSGISELARIAADNTGAIPRIASRCAVFAKTDLIHAQQEGYSLGEICDGLCRGLARNIVDTVFKHETPNAPLIFCGGVARNPAVISHISEMTGMHLAVDEMAPLYGAVGTALSWIEENRIEENRSQTDPNKAFVPRSPRPVVQQAGVERTYGHGPLALEHSRYPDFRSLEAYVYTAGSQGFESDVEIDIYVPLESGKRRDVYLGMDIGSTSTKAVWLTPDKQVIAGFYTRTAGRPVAAMCGVLEAMDDLVAKKGLDLVIAGAGTTGSGRKFVGRIGGADRIIDEITAHARAACELKADVDTIVEIGGQDSKFTTLKDGRVTFSIMNTVCAAGTGSFLEEQAEKLDVDLADYAHLTQNVSAPVASDRCTVFMERDINYYLSLGYEVKEVLAAALHSVRENYLTKVAVEAGIGQTVCFQGATAKNRSLVAAFEQRLGRPVYVSEFCHLTGAMGVALYLADEGVSQSAFRGLGLYKTQIPVRSEVCDLCPNHCKITIADMADGPAAFGFLCGRDYDTRHFVDNNRAGFDLVKTRGRVFAPAAAKPEQAGLTVGIPAALYLHEDVSMWTDFFHQLGMRTYTAPKNADVLARGKARAGAEFCAPITALHGHVDYLLEKTDFVFLPHYLENREKDGNARRQYCYYSQFGPALTAAIDDSGQNRIVSPVIRSLYNPFHTRLALYRAVRQINPQPGFFEIIRAYERAGSRHQEAAEKWRQIFKDRFVPGREVSVMFLGRPYTVLDPVMNKNIPNIFATLGVKEFFQDMLDLENDDFSEIAGFLEELHWNYAADIIKAAKVVSETPGLYPVLMTSFQCSPDSFIRDVFQSMMEGAKKPYLILELDEHGSSVGYETRIEAAVRAFDNHLASARPERNDAKSINPVRASGLHGKTVVLPSWDPITCRFLAANLQREGIDARVVTETLEAIGRSMQLNSGQCIPINVMAQEFVDYVRQNDLDPANTVMWMGDSEVPCNIRLYPYKIREMIASFGPDMAKAGVYTGQISFADVSLRAAANAYFAFMFGGLLRRMACRTRPYEKKPGAADRAVAAGIQILEKAFLGLQDKETAVIKTVKLFQDIETVSGSRPKVAIFGDLYARDNPVFNQDLISLIEACGGEALTTPYTDYAKMIAPAYFKKWFTEGRFVSLLVNRGLMATMAYREKTYFRHFQKVLKEPEPVYDVAPEKILSQFGMVGENTGESMDNILKIYYICRHHPEVALFVQTSPAFCCPSLITEAMAKTIEVQTGVPMVSITYDGTGGDKNRKIVPYLKYAQSSGVGVEGSAFKKSV